MGSVARVGVAAARDEETSPAGAAPTAPDEHLRVVLALLTASHPLRALANTADALAIAAAAAAAGKTLDDVARAMTQLAGKVAGGVALPTRKAAVSFVLAVRPGPGVARCGTGERARVWYAPADRGPALPEPDRGALARGWAEVLAACRGAA